LKKKKQKNFTPLGLGQAGGVATPPREQKFFGSFFKRNAYFRHFSEGWVSTMRASRIAAVCAVAQCLAPAASGAPQNAAAVATAIRQAVLAQASAGATITLGQVTGAQYMQACTRPLTVTVTGSEPYEQAAAHCASPGWTLYVTVTVMVTQAVVVAARPIAAGQVLQSGDLSVTKEPISLYAGRQIFYDPQELVGGTALMGLPAGTILTPSNIGEPVVVRAGQTVSVEVLSGGVEVSINAVADQTGRIGDTILMTNPSSGQRFPALVTRTGPIVKLQ
jgi:flagellar basal body P-ring formation protein FlgA